MGPSLVIIKPVGNRCNLKCVYCFIRRGRKEKQQLMKLNTLGATIKAVVSLDPLPIFFWGGGEPLLAGKEFFKKVIDLQLKYCGGRSFINSLQTNGTLIDASWIQFFKKHNFQIGISWDGSESSLRISDGSRTVNKKIWNAIAACLKEKLLFGIITVVTKQNINSLSASVLELYSLGIKNLLLKPYVGPLEDLSLTPTDYCHSMRALARLWAEKGDENWTLEPIYSFFKATENDFKKVSCGLINNCKDFLTIEPNGKITCCDFASHCFEFGNIEENNFQEMFREPAYRNFVLRKNKKEARCKRCAWRHVCGGGCLHYRRFDRDSNKWGKYVFCGATKKILSYCNNLISK